MGTHAFGFSGGFNDATAMGTFIGIFRYAQGRLSQLHLIIFIHRQPSLAMGYTTGDQQSFKTDCAH